MGAVSKYVGSERVFENDKIIVWNFELKPGEETPMHRHERPSPAIVKNHDISQPQSPTALWKHAQVVLSKEPALLSACLSVLNALGYGCCKGSRYSTISVEETDFGIGSAHTCQSLLRIEN